VTEGQIYQEQSTEELLDLARANAQALVIATAAFLEQAGIPLAQWTGYLGSLFANAWDDSTRGDAGAFMTAALTNYRSFGAEVVSATLERERAEALIAGFPNVELCAEIGADCDTAEAFYDVPQTIADSLGLSWAWSREGDAVRLRAGRR
jgi:hypothetical protein